MKAPKTLLRHAVFLVLVLPFPSVFADTFRVLFVYTPAAAYDAVSMMGLGNSLKYVADFTVSAALNEAYAASGSGMPTAELAGVTETTYNEDNMDDDLDRLTLTSDGYMDDIHTLRNLYAADVVLLLTSNGYNGLAFYKSDATTPVDAAHAFGVIDWLPSITEQSVHEIGHIFGCYHDVATEAAESPGPGTPLWPYWHGYRSTFITENWKDIMAYPKNGSTVWKYWLSNPDSSYNGEARGNTTTANCTRVHVERQGDVAAFKDPLPTATVSNRTFAAGHYADVVGNTVVTSGNVIFQNYSEGKFRATNTVVIGAGLKVEAGSNLSIRVGSNALAKPAADDGFENDDVVTPGAPAFSAQIAASRGSINLRYELPEDASVSLQIFKITGESAFIKNFGNQSKGRHYEHMAIDLGGEGMYVSRILVGKKAVNQIFYWVKK